MSSEQVSVHSRKYDGSVRRRWAARVVRLSGTLIVLEGVFEEEVRHPLIGTIHRGTRSTEFFWTDRWYSVFRFQEPDGRPRCFYCNVNTPAALEAGVLSFIDLDIDVLVSTDYSYRILDEDEFESNAELYKYPSDFRRRARESLAEIISLVERREFPFDAISESEAV